MAKKTPKNKIMTVDDLISELGIKVEQYDRMGGKKTHDLLKKAKIDYENALHAYNLSRIMSRKRKLLIEVGNDLEHARHTLELLMIEKDVP